MKFSKTVLLVCFAAAAQFVMASPVVANSTVLNRPMVAVPAPTTVKVSEIWACPYHACPSPNKPKVELSQSIWGTIAAKLGFPLPEARKL